MFSKAILGYLVFSTLSFAAPLKWTAPRGEGAGIDLKNAAPETQQFCFYNNDARGAATFNNPQVCHNVGPGQTIFVPLALSFKGRVQHGTDSIHATWAEFQIKASNDGKAHGDISLEQGCDRAATIASTDGTNVVGGFTKDILRNAPAAAKKTRSDGWLTLGSTMGNWEGPANQAAIKYENGVVGQIHAYIVGGTGVPDIASANNRLAVTFYAGVKA